MPCEVLDGRHVEVDTTVERLTLEEYLVHHGHCDGVRIGKTFLRDAGVAAINIVNLNIGRRYERIEYQTLVRVSQLQVILRLAVSGIKAEFQPALELCVEVGTYGETVEVTADDGTILIHVATRNKVFYLVVATFSVDNMLVHERCLEDGVLPVGTSA